MINEEALEALWVPIQYELRRDYVSLWEVVGRVQRQIPDLDVEAVRATTLALIERALQRGEAQAGTHPRGRDGLEHVWNQPTDQIISRIRAQWAVLGHQPKPGEVVWLEAPRVGA
jgi:hypothetical protein